MVFGNSQLISYLLPLIGVNASFIKTDVINGSDGIEWNRSWCNDIKCRRPIKKKCASKFPLSKDFCVVCGSVIWENRNAIGNRGKETRKEDS